MKFKSIFVAFIVLHLLLISVGLLSPDVKYVSIFGFIICFWFSVCYIKIFNDNQPTYKALFILIMVRLLLLGGFDLYMSITELANMPFLIIHLLGIVSGFFYLRFNNYLRFAPLAISLFFTVFMVFQGWDYWLHYRNFGTFTGRIVPYNLSQKIEGIDRQNNIITSRTLENKIVLLDFWHTRCGICFQKFPQLQAFYEKYKNDNSVVVFAVNKPIEEDKQKNVFQIIEEKGYNFPVLLPTDEELPEKFGVKGYPTTFVINQTGQIIYKGDIKGAIEIIEALKQNDL